MFIRSNNKTACHNPWVASGTKPPPYRQQTEQISTAADSEGSLEPAKDERDDHKPQKLRVL